MAYVYRLGRMDECAVVVAVCGIAETSKLGKSKSDCRADQALGVLIGRQI